MDTQQGSGIMIDCGEGTQHQLMRSTDIKITKIRFSSFSLILIPIGARPLRYPSLRGRLCSDPCSQLLLLNCKGTDHLP